MEVFSPYPNPPSGGVRLRVVDLAYNINKDAKRRKISKQMYINLLKNRHNSYIPRNNDSITKIIGGWLLSGSSNLLMIV